MRSQRNDLYHVTVWDERDRLHIALVDNHTDESMIDLWDDDARSMIEDGFVDPRRLLESLINYCKSVGLIGGSK